MVRITSSRRDGASSIAPQTQYISDKPHSSPARQPATTGHMTLRQCGWRPSRRQTEHLFRDTLSAHPFFRFPSEPTSCTPASRLSGLTVLCRRMKRAASYTLPMMPHQPLTTSSQRRFLTVRELAERIGVSTQTIRNWTKARAISPVLKRGRVIRYDWEQVAKDLGIGQRSTLHPAFEVVPCQENSR